MAVQAKENDIIAVGLYLLDWLLILETYRGQGPLFGTEAAMEIIAAWVIATLFAFTVCMYSCLYSNLAVFP